MDVFIGESEQAWSFVLSRNVYNGKLQVSMKGGTCEILPFTLLNSWNKNYDFTFTNFSFQELKEPAAMFNEGKKSENQLNSHPVTTLVDLETERPRELWSLFF